MLAKACLCQDGKGDKVLNKKGAQAVMDAALAAA